MRLLTIAIGDAGRLLQQPFPHPEDAALRRSRRPGLGRVYIGDVLAQLADALLHKRARLVPV